jgi:hypothetical protein
LTGCATAGFEAGGVAVCPPVVEYSRELQARAAEELALLPDGSAIVEMMGNYAVIRDALQQVGLMLQRADIAPVDLVGVTSEKQQGSRTHERLPHDKCNGRARNYFDLRQ